MHEAKSNLSKLVQDVLDGKRVRIARHGKPVVELRLIEQEAIREPGLM
jgi:prevent-host-death family protein